MDTIPKTLTEEAEPERKAGRIAIVSTTRFVALVNKKIAKILVCGEIQFCCLSLSTNNLVS